MSDIYTMPLHPVVPLMQEAIERRAQEVFAAGGIPLEYWQPVRLPRRLGRWSTGNGRGGNARDRRRWRRRLTPPAA